MATITAHKQLISNSILSENLLIQSYIEKENARDGYKQCKNWLLFLKFKNNGVLIKCVWYMIWAQHFEEKKEPSRINEIKMSFLLTFESFRPKNLGYCFNKKI